MNYYHIWCNLKDTRQDMNFVENLQNYLGELQRQSKIAAYRLTRRKLGFGPPELGEFHITIEAKDLVQLESAFDIVATRADPIESVHAKVFSMVTDFRSALYRDFPDPQRKPPNP